MFDCVALMARANEGNRIARTHKGAVLGWCQPAFERANSACAQATGEGRRGWPRLHAKAEGVGTNRNGRAQRDQGIAPTLLPASNEIHVDRPLLQDLLVDWSSRVGKGLGSHLVGSRWRYVAYPRPYLMGKQWSYWLGVAPWPCFNPEVEIHLTNRPF